TGFQFQFGRRTDASETFHFDRRQVGSGRFDGLTRRFGVNRPGYLSSFEGGRQRIFPTQRRQHQVDDLLIQGSFSECRQRLVDQAHRPSGMCFPGTRQYPMRSSWLWAERPSVSRERQLTAWTLWPSALAPTWIRFDQEITIPFDILGPNQPSNRIVKSPRDLRTSPVPTEQPSYREREFILRNAASVLNESQEREIQLLSRYEVDLALALWISGRIPHRWRIHLSLPKEVVPILPHSPPPDYRAECLLECTANLRSCSPRTPRRP